MRVSMSFHSDSAQYPVFPIAVKRGDAPKGALLVTCGSRGFSPSEFPAWNCGVQFPDVHRTITCPKKDLEPVGVAQLLKSDRK